MFAVYMMMMSWWARWPLKSPASRLFTQTFIQASNAENVSIWWRHHDFLLTIEKIVYNQTVTDTAKQLRVEFPLSFALILRTLYGELQTNETITGNKRNDAWIRQK